MLPPGCAVEGGDCLSGSLGLGAHPGPCCRCLTCLTDMVQRDVFNQLLIHAALTCTSSVHKNVAR